MPYRLLGHDNRSAGLFETKNPHEYLEKPPGKIEDKELELSWVLLPDRED